MGSFFTKLKNTLWGQSRQAREVSSDAVRVPVEEMEPANTPGRLADAVAPEGKEFYVHDGPAVSTVGDLADVLNQAPQETFRHHISGEQNDFAEWLRGVFDDEAAAAVVESARNPSEVVYILDTLSQ